MPAAAEICARFDPKPEVQARLKAGMRPREFLAALVTDKQYVCAIDFLAHLLPVRDSIWWGCLCLQHASGGNYSDVDKAAGRAAAEWIMRPEEPMRAAAKDPAEVAGPSSAAGALAMAVYQTGGNVALPRTPATSPAPYAWAKSVARAVKLASAKANPANIIETQKAFVFLGAGMAHERAWFEGN
jgi:hypothetical protein